MSLRVGYLQKWESNFLSSEWRPIKTMFCTDFSILENTLCLKCTKLGPSMDIQIASNFERLLYFILNKDTLKVREVMSAFRENERYCFENFEVSGFSSCSSEDSKFLN